MITIFTTNMKKTEKESLLTLLQTKGVEITIKCNVCGSGTTQNFPAILTDNGEYCSAHCEQYSRQPKKKVCYMGDCCNHKDHNDD